MPRMGGSNFVKDSHHISKLFKYMMRLAQKEQSDSFFSSIKEWKSYFEDESANGSNNVDKKLIFTYQEKGYDSGLFAIATAEIMHNQKSFRDSILDLRRYLNQHIIDGKNMRYVIASLILYFNEDDYPTLFTTKLVNHQLESTKQSSSTTAMSKNQNISATIQQRPNEELNKVSINININDDMFELNQIQYDHLDIHNKIVYLLNIRSSYKDITTFSYAVDDIREIKGKKEEALEYAVDRTNINQYSSSSYNKSYLHEKKLSSVVSNEFVKNFVSKLIKNPSFDFGMRVYSPHREERKEKTNLCYCPLSNRFNRWKNCMTLLT